MSLVTIFIFYTQAEIFDSNQEEAKYSQKINKQVDTLLKCEDLNRLIIQQNEEDSAYQEQVFFQRKQAGVLLKEYQDQNDSETIVRQEGTVKDTKDSKKFKLQYNSSLKYEAKLGAQQLIYLNENRDNEDEENWDENFDDFFNEVISNSGDPLNTNALQNNSYSNMMLKSDQFQLKSFEPKDQAIRYCEFEQNFQQYDMRWQMAQMTEEQLELKQISHLDVREQLMYIEKRLLHYQKAKELLYQRYPTTFMAMGKRMNQATVDKKLKQSYLLKQTFQFQKNMNKQMSRYALKNQIEQISNPIKRPRRKKLTLTLQLLQVLDRQFQMYYAAESGAITTAKKVSLANIGAQMNMAHSSIYRFYDEWVKDPGFKQKRIKLANLQRMERRDNILRIKSINKNDIHSNEQIDTRVSILNKRRGRKPNFNKINDQNRPINCPIESAIRFAPIHPEFNSQKTKSARFAFCEFFRKIQSNRKIYFLDECPKRAMFQQTSIENSQDFSLMAIVSTEGEASWKMVKYKGNKYSQIEDMLNLFNNARGQAQQNSKNCLIFDFQLARDTQKQNQIKKVMNTRLLILPHFSEQLNPLDYWFKDVSLMLKRAKASNLHDLNVVLQKFIGADFGKYIREAEKYVNTGLKKQDF